MNHCNLYINDMHGISNPDAEYRSMWKSKVATFLSLLNRQPLLN